MKYLGKGPRGFIGYNRKWKPERRPSHEKYVRGYWLIRSEVLQWGDFLGHSESISVRQD